MLTDSDLAKISSTTRSIVKEEVRTIVKEEVRTIVKEEIKKELKPIKKDIKAIISFFDRENIKLEKRMKRVENHLGLPPLT